MATQEDMKQEHDTGRRTMLKALAGVPVLGVLGVQVLRKLNFDTKHNQRAAIVRELGLEDLLSSVKQVGETSGDVIRIGIAGFGVVGKRRRQYIDLNPNMRTVAVCDQIFKTSASKDNGVKYFQYYKQLLEEPLDVLFVCLPNYLAAEVTIAGIEKGLHVFCEKPPACNVQDVERVIEVENKHTGQLLKYGFNHRYHESVRRALSIVKSNPGPVAFL